MGEDIEWFATAHEAAFWSAYEQAAELADRVLSGWPKERTRITPLKLYSGGRATITWFPGGPGSFAVVSLVRGRVAAGLTIVGNKADLPAADVQAVGRAAAARLDAGLTG